MEYFEVALAHSGETVEVDEYTTLLDLSKKYQKQFKSKILVARIDNTIVELGNKIKGPCVVEFLDVTSSFGFGAYQRSTSLLMLAAIRDVLGEQTITWVEHTINKNYYCQIRNCDITDQLLIEIENRMHEIVAEDLKIERITLPLDGANIIFKKYGLENRIKALKYVKSSNISMYKIGDFYDYIHGPMVPSTSYIKIFKLTKTDDGFLLQFVSPADPSNLNEPKMYPKLAQVFNEYTNWSRILKVDTVGSLNDFICNDKSRDIIWISEGLHEKKISDIADSVAEQKKRLIMIAGPSSSGKTTFAKRLCIQLRVNGLRPSVISLDDYYKNREDIPKEPDGSRNFERLETIDVEQFNNDLLALLSGETVQIPSFNFLTGKREYRGNFIKLETDDVLVIEGIHGINEKLTPKIPREEKFKIYISALTQLNIDEHNRIATTDTRLLRRIVRDHHFRGFSASSTIRMWPTVLTGEEMNIFPYQEEADAIFNSALVYELGVLKPFAEPILFQVDKLSPEYIEAKRLLKFLDSFLTIVPSEIPANSLLREFIGGSCFK